MGRRLRIIVVVLCATAVVIAAAAVVWRVVLRDTATPASIDDVLARYRAAAAEGTTPVPAGVYVYETTGSESVGALGGTTHAYPARTTITVTPADCGMSLRWDALETRSTTWEVCVGGDAGERQLLAGWVERHVFFGQDDKTDWRCGGSPWLADPGSGPFVHTCDAGDTTQAGSVEVLGTETIDVAGTAVETTHLVLEADEEGASRGPLREERWLESETGLPVRLVYTVRTANDSPIGDVTFEEAYTLDLVSLEPRT